MNDGSTVAKTATVGEGEAYAARLLAAPVAAEQGVTGLGKVASKLTKKGKSDAA